MKQKFDEGSKLADDSDSNTISVCTDFLTQRADIDCSSKKIKKKKKFTRLKTGEGVREWMTKKKKKKKKKVTKMEDVEEEDEEVLVQVEHDNNYDDDMESNQESLYSQNGPTKKKGVPSPVELVRKSSRVSSAGSNLSEDGIFVTHRKELSSPLGSSS
ncbi:hypothetical protein TL16_g04613 [Triparma laevis f. inornata]|uniref:Uncharacterized protein n=1 Tax=Triparma laevis f. inornata TaxID=1714386 RepID=A0A9W7AD22_9STRA|nr:hypothetical protein TL16_g04613 [Triparma laevis f. inornata]